MDDVMIELSIVLCCTVVDCIGNELLSSSSNDSSSGVNGRNSKCLVLLNNIVHVMNIYIECALNKNEF